jgi:uncharacterized membrane protein
VFGTSGHGAAGILSCAIAGFIAGLVVAAPLTGTAIGVLLGSAGSSAAAAIGIDDHFVHEVEAMMKPGTSVLFVSGRQPPKRWRSATRRIRSQSRNARRCWRAVSPAPREP